MAFPTVMSKGLGRKFPREYRSWVVMKSRCYNNKDLHYPYYGKRGIQVCDRWRTSFAAFLEDMGPRPPGTSLDRKFYNGHYEPNNCRWATDKQQGNAKANKMETTLKTKVKPLETAPLLNIEPQIWLPGFEPKD